MVEVFDKSGNQLNWQWLVGKFGPVVHKEAQAGGSCYRLVRLREVEGPASVVVQVLDAAGAPVRDVVVCWSWPDAPKRPEAGWTGRAELGRTDGYGQVGFAMGRGANYTPPKQGPHTVWLYGADKSDYVGGLGMLAGSNHIHLEPTFRWVQDEPTPEPEPEPEPGDGTDDERWAALFQKLDRIITMLEGLPS